MRVGRGTIHEDPLLGALCKLLALFFLTLDTMCCNLAANLVGPAYDFASLSPKRISYRTGGLITAGVALLGGLGWAVDAVPTLKNGSTIGIASPPAVLMPDGRIVKLGIRDGERLQGFETDWTQPAEAVAKPSARWGLVGSAVSVPVAQWVGQRLLVPGSYDDARDLAFPFYGKAPRAARFDGKRRHAVLIGTDPLGVAPPPLASFMRADEPQQPLSAKATAGFLGRAYRAKLRFEPGFIAAVEGHLVTMGGALPERSPSPQLDLLAA